MTVNQIVACMVMQGFVRNHVNSDYYTNPEYYKKFVVRRKYLVFGDRILDRDTINTIMIDSFYNYIQTQLRNEDKHFNKETNANT